MSKGNRQGILVQISNHDGDLKYMYYDFFSQLVKYNYNFSCLYNEQILENTEGAITNGQSRKTGSIGYNNIRRGGCIKNTTCVGLHNAQTNTNNVNKTWKFHLGTNRVVKEALSSGRHRWMESTAEPW